MKKNKRKYIFWDVLTKVSFAIMILALLYPFASETIESFRRGSAIVEYKDKASLIDKNAKAAELKNAEAYNNFLYNRQSGSSFEAVDYNSVLHQDEIMGYLDIPVLGMQDMPFYHGSTYDTLNKGLGHLNFTSVPVGGLNTHAVITGHTGMGNQVLFSDLNKLEKGDYFYINILHKRFRYKIISKKLILPEQVEAVKIQEGKDLVTLLTCYPIFINSHRLLVTGERVPLDASTSRSVVRRNILNIQNISMLFTVILLLGYIIIKLLKLKKEKKPLS